MATALIIGDSHLRKNHLSSAIELLNWINSIAEETKPNIVINLGDTFNDHGVIHSEILSVFNDHLRFITGNLGLQYYYVLGNHDMYKSNDSKYHALQSFKGRHNTHIVDTVTQDTGFTLIPYLVNPSKYPVETQKLVFTHNTFIGADFGPIISDKGIAPETLSADLTISGHIHKRGWCGDGKVYYAGTPMAISASEVNQAKGLTLIDLDTYEMKFIESPFPIWRSVRVGPSDVLELNASDHWIVTVVGPKAEVNAKLESKYIKDVRSKSSVVFKVEFTDKLKDKTSSIRANTVNDMVDQYMDRIYSGELDKSSLKERLKKILESDNA